MIKNDGSYKTLLIIFVLGLALRLLVTICLKIESIGLMDLNMMA